MKQMLKDDLQEAVKGEVTTDSEILTTFSRDASVFEVTPEIIVSPKDPEDIKSLVKYVSDHKDEGISLTPRSAGTCMSGGPLSESIVIDMLKHFNNVIEVGEDFAVTQPGVYYRDFEKATLEKGLLLPCFTASREINTVGGMVGNNSAGEKTLKYGQTKDYVQKLKVVLEDGNEYAIKPLYKTELDQKLDQANYEGKIYKKILDLLEENKEIIQGNKPQTHKNSTGYNLWDVWDGETFDLTKLFTGSQGTLGVITEIQFKLVNVQTNQSLLVIFLNDLNNLDRIVNKVLEYNPESFEFYDDQTMTYAVRFLRELSFKFKHNNMLSVYLRFLPEIIQNIRGELPKLVLLANFTAKNDQDVGKQSIECQKGLIEFKINTKVINNPAEAEKYWVIRHESFNMLRHHSKKMRTAPFIDDITVRPADLPSFLPKLNEIMMPYRDRMIYTIAGHIGDGNFHIIPLMDLTREEVRAVIPELSQKVFDLVFEYKGSMAAEHNDGLIRGPYLPQMYGEDIYQLFKEVKKIFDPNNIFNPNKKTDATFEYSFAHLAKN